MGEAQKLTPESNVRVAGHIHLLGDKAEANGDKIDANSHKDAASDIAYAVHVADLVAIAQASPDLPARIP